MKYLLALLVLGAVACCALAKNIRQGHREELGHKRLNQNELLVGHREEEVDIEEEAFEDSPRFRSRNRQRCGIQHNHGLEGERGINKHRNQHLHEGLEDEHWQGRRPGRQGRLGHEERRHHEGEHLGQKSFRGGNRRHGRKGVDIEVESEAEASSVAGGRLGRRGRLGAESAASSESEVEIHDLD